jgi:hypothetical protein
MNQMAMMFIKGIPKSESIDFDKYKAPVTVSTNVEVADMVRRLMESEFESELEKEIGQRMNEQGVSNG